MSKPSLQRGFANDLYRGDFVQTCAHFGLFSYRYWELLCKAHMGFLEHYKTLYRGGFVHTFQSLFFLQICGVLAKSLHRRGSKHSKYTQMHISVFPQGLRGALQSPYTEGDSLSPYGFCTHTYTHIHILVFFLRIQGVLCKAPIQQVLHKSIGTSSNFAKHPSVGVRCKAPIHESSEMSKSAQKSCFLTTHPFRGGDGGHVAKIIFLLGITYNVHICTGNSSFRILRYPMDGNGTQTGKKTATNRMQCPDLHK